MIFLEIRDVGVCREWTFYGSSVMKLFSNYIQRVTTIPQRHRQTDGRIWPF